MANIISKEEKHKLLEKENAGKTHISFSELSLYKQCGHRHLIEKHLKIEEQPPSIHLFFGNAIHESIEFALKENYSIDQRIEYFKSTFRKNMMDNMINTPEFADTDNFCDQGENILRILDLDAIRDEYYVISIEEPLYEKIFGFFYFKGFLDLCLRHKVTKRVKIVDWKTSGQKWYLSQKMKDEVFKAQMRLYKFFWARKNNVPLDNIDCTYIVLNRLKNKKKPEDGFGEIDWIDISSTKEEMKEGLEMMTKVVRNIHVEKNFGKVKHYGNERFGCMFCKYKGGNHPLCDETFTQANKLLLEHNKA